MRIVHITTIITPEGAYGGPVRVAANITKALCLKKLDAELWAGTRGYVRGRQTYDGARSRLHWARILVPKLGFSTTISPGLLRRLWSERKSNLILHIHMGRDLVTLPSALLARLLRLPYVLQTHGMVQSKISIPAKIFDAILTRPALRGARRVYYLTEQERKQLLSVEPNISALEHLINGVSVEESTPQKHARESTTQVLFMARLHARKRPALFVQAAIQLLLDNAKAKFVIVGPDEGEAGAVQKLIDNSAYSDSIIYLGPSEPSLTAEHLISSDIYVLPSVNEPFPMSVIEAMAHGLPVVVTATCGLAEYVENSKAGIVVNETLEDLISALKLLIYDSNFRLQLGSNALCLVKDNLNVDSVAAQLLSSYDQIAHSARESADFQPKGIGDFS